MEINTSVLVIGDLIVDKYWFGEVERLSPEAPVPVVKYENEVIKPGGAANVANNIANLGAHVTLIGMIGKDDDGITLESDLNKLNVKCDFIQSEEYKTISKLRIISRPNQIVRVDFEDTSQTIEHDLLEAKMRSKLNESSVVVISDYAKGVLSDEFTKKIIKLAKKMEKIILVDPKSDDFEKYSGATIMTPNLKEFENVVGKCENESEILSKGMKLRNELSLEHLLITLGAKGMLLISENNHVRFSSLARKVFDVTGAGDTVISFLAAMLGNGSGISIAVETANQAAGIAVGKIGSATVSMNEIQNSSEPKLENNIFHNINLLKKEIDEKRKNGATLVMTNGCFDLLHSGHIKYLERAKSLGNILVVALNSDESIRELKGENRPINNLNDRAIVLSSLSSVDYVLSFDELTPLKIYKALLPDILVKGGDYSIDEIVGATEVIDSGGKVEIIEFFDGYSSSKVIDQIIEKTTR
jgi:D-beta-D-heptose 7-phosphate kinase/D-beta-D-heptose 1-phosphate adenosyltransferase